MDFLQYCIAIGWMLDTLFFTKGYHSFITCLEEGFDILCAEMIAGYIHSQRKISEDIPSSPSYRLKLCTYMQDKLRLFNPVHGRIKAASDEVHNVKSDNEFLYIERAVEAATHVLAVYPEGEDTWIMDMVEDEEKTILRFTPHEILARYRARQSFR